MRRATSWLVALAVSGGLLFAAVQPASAATGHYPCRYGSICD